MTSSTTPAEAAQALPPGDPAGGTFDLREFTRTARGSHREELDFDAIARAGIGDEAAQLIRVLRDLDRATMARMRNMLVTATHKDARLTAFFTTWAFERFWVADALDAVLEATGHELASPVPVAPVRRRRGERVERRGPIRRAIIGNIQGTRLIAAQLAAALVDEWVTSAAYRRLGELAAAVGSVVDTVLQIKDRHIRFLAEEAHRRLGESRRVQRIARKTLARAVWPMGIVDRPEGDRGLFERLVFGDAAGHQEAQRIGALAGALPGMSALQPAIAGRLVP